MKKIITAILVLTLTQSQIVHADTYVGPGAIIGGSVGLVIGIAGAFADTDHADDDMTTGETILALGLITAAGAGVGALIGLAIPKHPKVSVAPIYTNSKTNGTTTGGSLAVHF